MSAPQTVEEFEEQYPEVAAVVKEMTPALVEQFQVDVLHAYADFRAIYPDLVPDTEQIRKVAEKIQHMRFDHGLVEVWDDGLFRITWNDESGDLQLWPCGEPSSVLDLLPEVREVFET